MRSELSSKIEESESKIESSDQRKTPAEAEDASKRKDKKSLKALTTLWPYLLRYRYKLSAALVALLIAAAAMLVLPLGVRRMIDQGFSSQTTTFIDQYFMVMISIGLVLAVASAARFYFVTWLGERVVADLRADVFAHVSRLSPEFFEFTRSGEVMSRLTADTTQIKTAVGSAVSQALRNLVMLIGGVIMMIITSPQLSALVLVAIPLIILPIIGYGRMVRRLTRRAQDDLAEASAYASEMLTSVRTLQAYTNEPEVNSRFSGSVELAFLSARQRTRARAGLTAMAIFLIFATIVVILWVGAQDVHAGTMTGGRLGQFVLYAVLAGSSLGTLSEVWGEIQQAAGATERITELLAVKSQISSPENPRPLATPVHGNVAFENVHFAYPTRPDQPALNDISFEVRAGETVAIVGASGSGKSTLFALLLRFYDPVQGFIKIDDTSIREVDLELLRGQISYVSQNPDVFDDSVAENIRFGSPDVSKEDIVEAAKAAQAHEFIEKLPSSYETRLGEKGTTLSGGQRQRIAIARAFLRKAPILLLDEATSALDSESEEQIQIALERVKKDRTTLVIAHRLSTVQNADKILVLEEGRLVESGKHNALISENGIYSRLANLQFVGQAAE